MKIVVIGGTGLIGSKLVNKLREMGEEVLAASPNSGVNTLTGEGLREALAGRRVVVDVSNSPSFEDEAVMEFFRRPRATCSRAEARRRAASRGAVGRRHRPAAGKRLLPREDGAGEAIKASQIPYTILRSTQFFEFVAASRRRARTARAFAPHRRSSSRSCRTTWSPRSPRSPSQRRERNRGGGRPRAVPSRRARAPAYESHRRRARGDHGRGARYFGALLGERTLTPERRAFLGTMHFADWVADSAATRRRAETDRAEAAWHAGRR